MVFLISYGLSRLPFSYCKHFGTEKFVKDNVGVFRCVANSFLAIIFIFGIILLRKERLFWPKIIVLAVFILAALFFINMVFFATSQCSIDARQQTNVGMMRVMEKAYFEKHGRYASLEELNTEEGFYNLNDEFTKELYKIEIASDGMNFWIKAYLPQAEDWYICDKDRCFIGKDERDIFGK